MASATRSYVWWLAFIVSKNKQLVEIGIPMNNDQGPLDNDRFHGNTNDDNSADCAFWPISVD